MPVIARFCGVTVKMYLRQKEHNPPHVHALYGEYVGMFSLESGEMFEGDIPVKVQQLVKDFIKKNQDQLNEMWITQKFQSISYEK